MVRIEKGKFCFKTCKGRRGVAGFYARPFSSAGIVTVALIGDTFHRQKAGFSVAALPSPPQNESSYRFISLESNLDYESGFFTTTPYAY